jgi:cysteine desulfurase
MKKKIYFDYAATTPVDPKVLKEMMPYFSDKFANSMSFHSMGQEVSEIIEDNREKLAGFIGAKANEIIFTGSATESNNMVLKGIMEANKNNGNHLIISSIEHDCVLGSAKFLEKNGCKVTYLDVDKNGFVKLDDLERSIDEKTVLVSIIHGNNEIGTIQDLKKIGEICKKHNVYFHTDASQSFGKVKIDVEKMNIDLMTASSHKIYGPKGAALLYIKEGIKIQPLLHGGGHEFGLRSSTLNTPAIIGFVKAAEMAMENLEEENRRISGLRDKLIEGILKNIKGTALNGDRKERLSNNVNISFGLVEGESLLLELDDLGIECSTGSACSSRTLATSHVLLALGKTAVEAHGSIRFSLGRFTKESDVNYLLKVLPRAVEKLRQISPFKL